MSPAIRAAYIGAVGAVVASIVGVVLERADSAPSDPVGVVAVGPSRMAMPSGSICVRLERAVLSFAERYPVAAQRYASAGDDGLPKLATPGQRALCGDPERLLEQMPVKTVP